jgi:hypothetical protein
MQSPAYKKEDPAGRSLDIEEVRLVSDLRIMHAKVDELFQVVNNLKRRHHEADIGRYADHMVLGEDINHVDEIYLWFVGLKENLLRKSG